MSRFRKMDFGCKDLVDAVAIYDEEKQNSMVSVGEVVELLNELAEQNMNLREELFEANKELLWATSDEVDRALYFDDEVEELRKEIFGWSCTLCQYQYLIQREDGFYIQKCKKGHEKCSTGVVKYCLDFVLKKECLEND